AAAGILIHELQLNFAEHGLKSIADLGKSWFDQYQLPLPLGANAIRRSLPEPVKRDVARLLHQSIAWGLQHRGEILALAAEEAHAGLDLVGASEYIDRYVNHHTLKMDDHILVAMDHLFDEAAKLHSFRAPLRSREHVLTVEV